MQSCKRAFSLAMAIFYFTTQIVFAQNVMMAMPAGAVPNFFRDLQLKCRAILQVNKVVFRSLPFSDRLREDRDRSGYMSPERVMERERAQLNRIETPQELLNKRGLQPPEQYGGKTNQPISPEQFFQNMEAMRGLQGEIARVRSLSQKDVSAGTEASYIMYNDGKQVFSKDGLTTRVLNEQVLDARGNVTMRNTTAMTYDNKRLMSSYITDDTDVQGNIVTVQRKNITYTPDSVYYASKETEAKQQITGFEENRIDPLGNVSTIVRSEMKYDDRSRVTYYKEEQIDPFGNKTDKVWSSGQYDGNDNLIAYDETTVDSFGNKSSRNWGDAQYIENSSWKGDSDKSNSKYLLTGYTQTVRDPSGAVSTERWSDAQYNPYGELTYNKTTRTDFLGYVTTTEMSNAQYNSYGQMTAYRQTMTDSFGNLQIMDRTHISYTKIGDQSGYNENLMDGKGRVIERVRSNIVYNDKRLMIGYFESEIDPEGRRLLKDWSSLGADEGYNEKGMLKGFREKIYAGDLEITKSTTKITYDKLGKQSGSIEDTKTVGKDEMGNVVDGHVLITTTRLNTSEDAEGKIVGYRELARTEGWGAGGQLIRDLTVTRDRNNITLTSYDETTITEGKDGSEGLRTESFAERKDMVMDGLGRLVSYKEDYTAQKGAPESKVHREVSTISYDLKNQLLGSYEESVDSQGVKTVTVLGNSLYNSQGQAIAFDRTTVQSDGKETVTTQLERSRISYNAMGDMLSYHDRTSKPNSQSSKKVDELDWRAIDYNKNGQLTGYRQEYRDNG
ncbi:MAG: hypothetical protein HYS58_00370, partial [Elusimicrobia bacterium]|nr:hypothetical protein [Elusimicrobiota bacterium]